MNKILGIDYGSRQIGIAISDVDRIVGFPREIIVHETEEEGISRVIEYAKKENIEEAVLGLPIGLSGEDTAQTKETRAFGEKLQTNGLKISFEDERLTTALAEKSGGKRKDADMMAAQLILQTYLDREKTKENKEKDKK